MHGTYIKVKWDLFVKRSKIQKGGNLSERGLGFLTKYIMNLWFNYVCLLLPV